MHAKGIPVYGIAGVFFTGRGANHRLWIVDLIDKILNISALSRIMDLEHSSSMSSLLK